MGAAEEAEGKSQPPPNGPAGAPAQPVNPPVFVGGHECHFPHQPYGVQLAFMNKLIGALNTSQNALLEAPTGCGKTLSLLVSALAWQEKRKKAAMEKYMEESDAWHKRQASRRAAAQAAAQANPPPPPAAAGAAGIVGIAGAGPSFANPLYRHAAGGHASGGSVTPGGSCGGACCAYGGPGGITHALGGVAGSYTSNNNNSNSNNNNNRNSNNNNNNNQQGMPVQGFSSSPAAAAAPVAGFVSAAAPAAAGGSGVGSKPFAAFLFSKVKPDPDTVPRSATPAHMATTNGIAIKPDPDAAPHTVTPPNMATTNGTVIKPDPDGNPHCTNPTNVAAANGIVIKPDPDAAPWSANSTANMAAANVADLQGPSATAAAAAAAGAAAAAAAAGAAAAAAAAAGAAGVPASAGVAVKGEGERGSSTHGGPSVKEEEGSTGTGGAAPHKIKEEGGAVAMEVDAAVGPAAVKTEKQNVPGLGAGGVKQEQDGVEAAGVKREGGEGSSDPANGEDEGPMDSSSEPGPDVPLFNDIDIDYEPRPVMDPVPRIFFATRTHSQIAQVVRELKRTSYKPKMSVLAARKHYCVHSSVIRSGNIDENCDDLLKSKIKGCLFAQNIKRYGVSHSRVQVHDLEDLLAMGKQSKFCPYFAARDLAAAADLVFCPYNYILSPVSRSGMGINVANSILIFDEAHNIEDQAREAGSCEIDLDTMKEVHEVLSTCCTYCSRPDLYRPLQEMMSQLIGWLDAVSSSRSMVTREFGRMEATFQESRMLGALAEAGFSAANIPVLWDMLMAAKQHESEARFEAEEGQEGGAVPANVKRPGAGSSLSVISQLLIALRLMYGMGSTGPIKPTTSPEKSSVCYRLVVSKAAQSQTDNRRRGRGARETEDSGASQKSVQLALLCMDPARPFLDACGAAYSTILTSGTLSPLGTFAQELGTDFAATLEGPHVIDMKRQVWATALPWGPSNEPMSLTMASLNKFNVQDQIGQGLVQVVKIIPDGVLVFVGSYGTMDKLQTRWKATGVWDQLCELKEVVVEPKQAGRDFDAAMDTYKTAVHQGRGALLLGIFRGKASEGIDFADSQARGVVLIGIPYANRGDIKTNMKQAFNDNFKTSIQKGRPTNEAGSAQGSSRNEAVHLSGHAWYNQSAFRALNQAMGRCIRHKYDYGAIILMDNRFLKPSSQAQLSRWVRGNLKSDFPDFKSTTASLKLFFANLALNPPKRPALPTHVPAGPGHGAPEMPDNENFDEEDAEGAARGGAAPAVRPAIKIEYEAPTPPAAPATAHAAAAAAPIASPAAAAAAAAANTHQQPGSRLPDATSLNPSSARALVEAQQAAQAAQHAQQRQHHQAQQRAAQRAERTQQQQQDARAAAAAKGPGHVHVAPGQRHITQFLAAATTSTPASAPQPSRTATRTQPLASNTTSMTPSPAAAAATPLGVSCISAPPVSGTENNDSHTPASGTLAGVPATTPSNPLPLHPGSSNLQTSASGTLAGAPATNRGIPPPLHPATPSHPPFRTLPISTTTPLSNSPTTSRSPLPAPLDSTHISSTTHTNPEATPAVFRNPPPTLEGRGDAEPRVTPSLFSAQTGGAFLTPLQGTATHPVPPSAAFPTPPPSAVMLGLSNTAQTAGCFPTPLPSAVTPGFAHTSSTAMPIPPPSAVMPGFSNTAQTVGCFPTPLPSTAAPSCGGGSVTPPTLAKRGNNMTWQPSSGSGGDHAQTRFVRHKAEHSSSGGSSGPGQREKADGGAWVSLVALTGTPKQQQQQQQQQQTMQQPVMQQQQSTQQVPQQQPSQVMYGVQPWQQADVQGWAMPQSGGGALLGNSMNGNSMNAGGAMQNMAGAGQPISGRLTQSAGFNSGGGAPGLNNGQQPFICSGGMQSVGAGGSGGSPWAAQQQVISGGAQSGGMQSCGASPWITQQLFASEGMQRGGGAAIEQQQRPFQVRWGVKSGGSAHMGAQRSPHVSGSMLPHVSGVVHSSGINSSGGAAAGQQLPHVSGGMPLRVSGVAHSGASRSGGSTHLGWQQPQSGGGVGSGGSLTQGGRSSGTGGMQQQPAMKQQQQGFMAAGSMASQIPGMGMQQHGFQPMGAMVSSAPMNFPGNMCGSHDTSSAAMQQQQYGIGCAGLPSAWQGQQVGGVKSNAGSFWNPQSVQQQQ